MRKRMKDLSDNDQYFLRKLKEAFSNDEYIHDAEMLDVFDKIEEVISQMKLEQFEYLLLKEDNGRVTLITNVIMARQDFLKKLEEEGLYLEAEKEYFVYRIK